jgi:hypothetical protein
MSLICWNCRGLGNPWAVRELCRLVKEKRPHFLFLIETKVCLKKLQVLRKSMGFEGLFSVDPMGKSGGLGLFWKEGGRMEIQNYSLHHINVKISLNDLNGGWTFTGFYGYPDQSQRDKSWKLLSTLHSFNKQAWLCIWDFNEILDQSEKVGGALRNYGQMEDFRRAIHECNLGDLGYTGSKFTWSNKRENGVFVKERLNRALANSGWCGLFPNASVEVLPVTTSDHKPLLLRFNPKIQRIPKLFRYEAYWNIDEECGMVINHAWNSNVSGCTAMEEAHVKLNLCQQQLSTWNRQKYGEGDHHLRSLEQKLERLQRRETPGVLAQIKHIQGEINKALEMEDIKWKQRAKRHWYRQGDRNTQYFHAWANQRRRSNFLSSIKDLSGTLWTNPDDIGMAFTNYFQQLFSTKGVTGVDECIGGVTSRVSPDMNARLTAVFTPEEVDHALGQMHPLKSPGPDGFGASFYQKHWQIVGTGVRKAVLDFLNRGVFDQSINSTFIALIPKLSAALCVSEFRPISLCNVIYKLISKVLANRLKQVLPSIISQYQSAFVPGRLITDNILVAYKALHSMDTRMKGRKGYMAVKLDMSKAYDRVEWSFLEAMMEKLGFAEGWILMIMRCVTSVTYFVLVNGVPHGMIKPSRGIRQGDPLSPYLFLLVAEGLSSMLVRAEMGGQITGVPITAGVCRLSHLFFAEDSLLFGRANFNEWVKLMVILKLYENASGQQLNSGKTSIFFSKNTRAEFRNFLRTSSGISSTSRYEKYRERDPH